MRPIQKGGKLKITTNYHPFQSPDQIKRWKIYGCPDQPSPEHNYIDTVLTKWTNIPTMHNVSISSTKESQQEWKKTYNNILQWTKEKQKHNKFPNGEQRDIPLIPLLQEEVKTLLRNKQDKDEAKVIKHLAETEGIESIAGQIYKTWNLDRQQIKECHIAMKRDRQLQVTFNNIVAATRFKVFDTQRLVQARCQKKGCGSVDSWEHFLRCYEIPDISELEGQEKVKAIKAICEKAAEPNPVRPKPSETAYTGTLSGQRWENDNSDPELERPGPQ